MVDYALRGHLLLGEIDSIVCRKRTPSQSKSNDRRTKAQNARSRDVTRTIPPRTGVKILGGQSQDDEIYDRHGDPRVPLIRVHVSVPDETRHERQNGDDYDRGRTGNPRLIPFANCPESQSAGDAIDRAPSDARDYVQDNRDAVWEVEGE